MKKNLRYIYLAFSASVILTFLVSILLYNSLSRLQDYNEQIVHAEKVLNKIRNVQYLLSDAENSQRAFLLTHDTLFLASFDRNKRLIYPEIDSLENLIDKSEEQRRTLIKLRSIVANRYQVLSATIDEAVAGDEVHFFENYKKGQNIIVEFNTFASKMEQTELLELKEKESLRRRYENATPAYLLITLLISISFLILSLILIMREFRKRHGYQKELERKIHELNTSHAELEQIAFIASHDLQEPLRKMRTFGGRLLMQYKEKLDEDGNMMLSRIDVAARRMQGLIEDIVDYTNLISSEEPLQLCSLNLCIEDVVNNLSNLVAHKSAAINVSQLPSLQGYPFQLQLLFTNLIHNAIKFSKPDASPVITISSEEILAANPYRLDDTDEPYLVIKVEDNGIGFENEFAKKIFVIFQRLHNQSSKYEGKGIGLAICKRVMTNHNGFISAEGQTGKGAIFNLYFPL